jgi:hypothetical protein
MIFLYIWGFRFLWPHSWIVILALVLLSHAVSEETPAALGFGRQALWHPFAAFAPLIGLLSLALLAVGIVFHTLRPVRWDDAFFSLAFYFFWGLFQQYLLNGYFLNRFRRSLPYAGASRLAAIAAMLFCLIHLPNWLLMGITLVGGYLSARVYLKYRNLYFLGFAHGLIGFLIYLVVPDTISHHLYVGPKWFMAAH